MDMVAVKDADCAKDMTKDGLDLKVDGDWLYAVSYTHLDVYKRQIWM